MTVEEKDRCIEILFYLYFSNVNENHLGKIEFWNTINNLCKVYDIDNLAVSKAVRLLLVPENTPHDKETYYLLNKLGLSVRPINRISGIYWQRQIQFQKEFEAGDIPHVRRRIIDIVIKRSMRDFILAMYNLFGIFGDIGEKTLYESVLK